MLQVHTRFRGIPPTLVAFGSDRSRPDPPAYSPARGRSLRELTGLRVLIVEDEALISLELETMFAMLGLEVVGTAHSSDEAVQMAAETRPDFLSVDVNLIGERDGVDAAREIYERFGLRSVFVTAYGDAQTVENARPARPLGWLAKPVTRQELREALPVMLAGLDEN